VSVAFKLYEKPTKKSHYMVIHLSNNLSKGAKHVIEHISPQKKTQTVFLMLFTKFYPRFAYRARRNNCNTTAAVFSSRLAFVVTRMAGLGDVVAWLKFDRAGRAGLIGILENPRLSALIPPWHQVHQTV
jgi:hypothetical protein